MKRIAQIVLTVFLLICANNLFAKHTNHKQSDTTVCNSPDVEPSFPNSQGALGVFLFKNLKWPPHPLDNINSKIFISFIVEKDGELTHFAVDQKISPAYSAEALRVAKLMPRWQPGTLNGKPVRCHYQFPITICFSRDSDD